MLTVPALILIGLPPGVANGTNRLAVVLQSLTALAAYKKLKQTDSGLAIALVIPAMLGSVCGALVSVRLDDEVFQTLLASMMMVMLIPIVFEPFLNSKTAGGKWDRPGATPAPRHLFWHRTLRWLTPDWSRYFYTGDAEHCRRLEPQSGKRRESRYCHGPDWHCLLRLCAEREDRLECGTTPVDSDQHRRVVWGALGRQQGRGLDSDRVGWDSRGHGVSVTRSVGESQPGVGVISAMT